MIIIIIIIIIIITVIIIIIIIIVTIVITTSPCGATKANEDYARRNSHLNSAYSTQTSRTLPILYYDLYNAYNVPEGQISMVIAHI